MTPRERASRTPTRTKTTARAITNRDCATPAIYVSQVERLAALLHLAPEGVLAAGGLRVDAGGYTIRTEAAGDLLVRKAIARFYAEARRAMPALLELARAPDRVTVLDDSADPRCLLCGCTESCACPGGCSWVDSKRTFCSACTLPKSGNLQRR